MEFDLNPPVDPETIMESRKRTLTNNNKYLSHKKRCTDAIISQDILSELGVDILSDDDDDEDIYNNYEKEVADKFRENQIAEMLPAQDFVYKCPGDSLQLENPFSILPDELVLEIMRRLNQKSLLLMSQACQRFYRLYKLPSLWPRLDLNSRKLEVDSIGQVLSLGVKVLRLNSTVFPTPIFSPGKFENLLARVKYLDLSYAWIELKDLSALLSKMRCLVKLSLESLKVDIDVIDEVSKNPNLDTLNLAMVVGLDYECIQLLTSQMTKLESLNVGWTRLNCPSLSHLCNNLTPNIKHVDVSGGQLLMKNSDLVTLIQRSPLIESLNISDCLAISVGTFREIIKRLPRLRVLEISRCYQIENQVLHELKELDRLEILSAFRLIPESMYSDICSQLPGVKINKNFFGAIARPTVGIRRTSIWEQATRD